MSFNGKYIELNQKKIKGIIDFYSHKFFYFKKVLDLGCGYADISASLLRLGSDITAVDARQEHLKIVNKKYPEMKTIKADLDKAWPVPGKKFDVILDIDLLCHISNYEDHLRKVCASTHHLVLETAVCDEDDEHKSVMIAENKANYDLSFNGNGSRPTAKAIERVLKECGMNFKRMDNAKFNAGTYKYDWIEKGNGECNNSNRRIWFAVRNDSPIQFSQAPKPVVVSGPGIIHQPYSIASKSSVITTVAPGYRKFVIVIPSYNNEKWCEKNIQSAINQDYSNYRIIFTDDCSKDSTFEKVRAIVDSSPKKDIITIVKNEKRLGALENLYNMIHSCDDEEIILTLDGDDWFPEDGQTLNKLHKYYADDDVWMTYGQYKNSTDGANGVASEYPKSIIDSNAIRSYKWGASHLRTFYSWLFKKIKKEDLFYNGNFMQMTWDLGTMYPMLEMSGHHSKFISEILYVYNMANPISDHMVDVKLQQKLDKYVRSLPKYSRVERPLKKNGIGLMVIATGKYDRFIQPLIESADKFFLKNGFDVTYYAFTDSSVNIISSRKIVKIPITHRPFPYASMDRFEHFLNNSNILSNERYLYYVDVDCLFVNDINSEIIGDLVGVQHCGYLNRKGPTESNIKSVLYTDQSRYKKYYGGGFFGGKTDEVLKLCQWGKDMIAKDQANNIMPVHHDETVMNRYFIDHEPTISLTPSYHYPQGNLSMYKKMWAPQNFEAKILLLEKNHKEVRGE
jgi:glycosyltransferase involved in cell wall biosynthesis/2-polyprenyl-3-methyl-5-hydroxy-6-metoxy-1,4-benzoquinol methylase